MKILLVLFYINPILGNKSRTEYYNFPAFDIFFFLILTALARILFRAAFAFISLNRSKSVKAFRFSFIAMRLAHEDSSHFFEIPSVSQAARTTLVRAENGNFVTNGVKCKFLMRYACLVTPVQGPSRSTRF